MSRKRIPQDQMLDEAVLPPKVSILRSFHLGGVALVWWFPPHVRAYLRRHKITTAGHLLDRVRDLPPVAKKHALRFLDALGLTVAEK